MEENKAYRITTTKDGKTYNIVKRKLKNGANRFKYGKEQIENLRRK